MTTAPAPLSAPLLLCLSRTVAVQVEVTPDDVFRVLPDDRLRDECIRRGLMAEVGAATLDGAHIRVGRAMLNWSVARLAASSGVSASTIKRLEDGTEGQTRPVNIAAAIRGALQGGGVRFLSQAGETCIMRVPADRASHDKGWGAP